MSEQRRHPDIFTAEEAAEYLRLDSVRTLEWLRDNFALTGHLWGKCLLFWREDLDAVALRVFGKVPVSKTSGRGMRIAK